MRKENEELIKERMQFEKEQELIEKKARELFRNIRIKNAKPQKTKEKRKKKKTRMKVDNESQKVSSNDE